MSIFSLHDLRIPIGIGAVAVAYVTYLLYRRLAPDKRRNVWSEVCEERETLQSVIDALPGELDAAKRSRLELAERQGLLGGETVQRWLGQLEVDLAEVVSLGAELAAADGDPGDESDMEQDVKLVEILSLSMRANRLADRYHVSLAADNAELDRLSSPPGLLAELPRALQQSISVVSPS